METVRRTYVVLKEFDQQLGIEAILKGIEKSQLLNQILYEYFKNQVKK